MRWPLSLLFRGDRDAPVATGDAGAAEPGAPGAASSPAGPAGAPARPAAWSSLPPVQRAIGEMALTAPTAAFVRDLAVRRSPEPILRPLAHDLAADGPAGLVSGIATPLAAPLRAGRRARRSRRAAATPRGPAPRGGRSRPPRSRPARSRTRRRMRRPRLLRRRLPARRRWLPALPPPRELPVVAPSATAPALAATRVGGVHGPRGGPGDRAGLGVPRHRR